jgi:hypothetical protein
MLKLVKTDFFLKRQGLLLPASIKQTRSKETSTDKFLFQTSEEDTSQTSRLIQRGHATRPGATRKAEGVTLSSDQRGFPESRQLRHATREESHLLGLSALPVG